MKDISWWAWPWPTWTFRIGGLIRSRYSAAGALGEETIENRILAYEPQRMIAIRTERPPKSFPFREAWKSTWTVVKLSDLGNNRTHIRVASMGYGTDQESMAMRRFFESGNAATLKTLQSHFNQSSPVPDGKRTANALCALSKEGTQRLRCAVKQKKNKEQ